MKKKQKEEERKRKAIDAETEAKEIAQKEVTKEESTHQIYVEESQKGKLSIINKIKQALGKIPRPSSLLKKMPKRIYIPNKIKEIKSIILKSIRARDIKSIGVNQKMMLSIIVIIIASAIIILGIFLFSKRVHKVDVQSNRARPVANYEEIIKNIKMNFILKDIQQVRRNIAAIGNSKPNAMAVPISRTMAHKELLFNIDEAVKQFKEINLKKIKNKAELAEIYNLFSIYHSEVNKQKALKWAMEATKTSPNNAIYELNLVYALSANAKKKEAKDLLKKIIPRLSSDKSLKEYAYTLMGILDKDNTIDIHKEILKLNPTNGETLLLLALEQGKKLNYDKEKEILIKFMKLLPASTDSKIKNFRLVPLKSRYTEIGNKMKEKIALKKRDPLWLAVDGVISATLGNSLQAEKALQESLKVEAGNLYAVIGIAYQNLKEGKTDETFITLLEEKKKYKELFAINALIGISHLREGNFLSAKKYLEPLLKTYGHLSQPWSWVAQANLGLKNEKEAFSQFQKSIKIDPYDPVAVKSLISAKRFELLNTKAIDKIFPF